MHTPLPRTLISALLAVSPVLAQGGPAVVPQGAPKGQDSATSFTYFQGGAARGEVEMVATTPKTVKIHHTQLIRGWKDDLIGEVRFNQRGIPVSFQIAGESSSTKGFKEQFHLAKGEAVWSSPGEKGYAKTKGGFYLSPVVALHPMFTLWLTEALKQGNKRSIQLIPSGEVRISEDGPLRIPAREGVTTLRQFRLEGLDFEPAFVWFTLSGKPIAASAPYLMIVRKGWEDRFDVMDQARLDALKRLDRRRGELARLPVGTTFAVRGVNLFAPETRTLLADQTLIVREGRIDSVGPTPNLVVPSGLQIIEARGKTLIPGLWNSHHHASGLWQAMAIAAGVTSAHDPGADPRDGMELARESATGLIPGPRLISSMLLDGSGPNTAQPAVVVDTPEECERALDRAKREGFFGIKLYGSLKPELVPDLIRGGRERGLWVGGHVPAGYTATDLVGLGFTEINHIYFALLPLWPDLKDKSNGMARFTGPAERAHQLDLRGAEVQRLISFYKQHGTVIDPTLVVMEDLLDHEPGTPDKRYGTMGSRLPSVPRRIGRNTSDLAESPEQRTRNQASLKVIQGFIRELHRAGIPIVPGTDSESFHLAHELALYVQAGIPAPEVLYLATLGASKVFGQAKDTGSLEPGKWADMVLIDGNPAERIEDLEKVIWTCKGGVIYDREKLLLAIGFSPSKIGNVK